MACLNLGENRLLFGITRFINGIKWGKVYVQEGLNVVSKFSCYNFYSEN
jgi:hypothetical protein